MWVATLFASNKWIGEKMWTATLLARYKCAGEKMLIIVKCGAIKYSLHIFVKGIVHNDSRRGKNY